MEKYQPPFTITNQMLLSVSAISEKTGAINSYREFETKPHLRKNNRIRSIHASLAIEANSLSLDEVRGVIDGKTVLGPQDEIQEVLNAYRAYEMLGSFDPYQLEDLKKLHGIMTDQLVSRAGNFRTTDEGVFHDGQCIFIAPPPRLVPDHMRNLFDWMNDARDEIHPLILSSVFHYEFVFIHPFADGNGRMARLWQTALLAEWRPVFQYLPLESRIQEYQQSYYDAISASHIAGNSDPFILFMLQMIDRTLDQALRQAKTYRPKNVSKLLDKMEYDVPYTVDELLELMGLKSKSNLRKNYLNPALDGEYIVMAFPDKPTSKNQTYIKKSE